MKQCINCGAELEEQVEFCAICGAEQPGMDTGARKKKRFFSFGKEQEESHREAEPAERDVCPICGMETTARVCPGCGTPLGPQESTTRTGGKKWATRVACGLAAVGLTAAAGMELLGLWLSPMGASVEQLGKELPGQLEQMSTLTAYRENRRELLEAGEFTLEVDLDTGDRSLCGTVAYDRGAETLAGELEWRDESRGIDTIVTFSADDKVVMFRFPESPDTYGCKLKEFADSDLAGLLPVKLGPELLEELFRKPDPEKENKELSRAVRNFLRSVEREEISPSQDHPGLRAYQIHWDGDDLKALLGQVEEEATQGSEYLRGVSGTAVNLTGDAGRLLAQFVAGYLEQDCRLYVNGENRLGAADFTVKPLLGLGGDIITLNIADPEHPWQAMELTSRKGSTQGMLAMNADGAELGLEIRMGADLALDVGGKFDNSTGAFFLTMELGELHGGIQGMLDSADGRAKLTLAGDRLGMPGMGLTLGYAPTPDGAAPEMISDNGKFVDVTDRSNWDRMYLYLTSGQ